MPVNEPTNDSRGGASPVPAAPRAPRLGAILAGGAARRFGGRKPLARIGGVPLIERVRNALLEAVDEAVVVTADPSIAAAAGLPSIRDAVAGAGPIAGICAALRWAADRGADGVTVVGGDLPFLAPALLRALSDRAGSSAVLAVAPETDRGFQPMCAWYAVRALPLAESRLHAGLLEVRSLLRLLVPERVSGDELRRYGSEARIFMNVNTRADLEAAERIASEVRTSG